MASGTDEKPSIILMPLLPILAIPTIISETEVIVKKPAGAIHSWVVWLQLHYPIETLGIVVSLIKPDGSLQSRNQYNRNSSQFVGTVENKTII